MNHYKIGLEMDVRVIGPTRARVSVGATDPGTLAKVEAEAKVTALSPRNTGKKFFGFGRLVPQDDILPEDQLLTKNSDDQVAMDKWVATASADPQMIWAGYFDNATKKLVKSSVGDAVMVKPDPAPQKQGSNLGLIAAVAATALGGMVFFGGKKKKAGL